MWTFNTYVRTDMIEKYCGNCGVRSHAIWTPDDIHGFIFDQDNVTRSGLPLFSYQKTSPITENFYLFENRIGHGAQNTSPRIKKGKLNFKSSQLKNGDFKKKEKT